MSKTHLLIIDPQNDFCNPNGALYVVGADTDMEVRLPQFIGRHNLSIDQIHVTLDSHHLYYIADQCFWQSADGLSMPPAFTVITLADIISGKWKPRNPELTEYVGHYVNTLAADGKYPLIIWPTHCVIGSWGHNITDVLSSTLGMWEGMRLRNVNYITKGSNMLTEHYSAIEADVKVESDPSTMLNLDLLVKLNSASTILVAGEASSHCVASTVRDLIKNVPTMVHKIVLLVDAMSPVRGFEAAGQAFLDEMKALGVRTATTTTWTENV